MRTIALSFTCFLLVTPMLASLLKSRVEDYDVIWNELGKNSSDSMPIGNGQVGLNVWTESNGDILFYISRTDSLSETCRFLKIGRVRLHFEPNPFSASTPPTQRLRLKDGIIDIGNSALQISLFVDALQPTIRISGASKSPVKLTASAEIWRTANHRLQGEELSSSWTMRDAPESVEVWESADVVADAGIDKVCWFHHNESSVVPIRWNAKASPCWRPWCPTRFSIEHSARL